MIKVSQNVYNGLEACRNAGSINMFERVSVAIWCLKNGYDETYHWIMENKSEYGKGIFEGFGVEDN